MFNKKMLTSPVGIRIGIAYSAAHAWKEPASRPLGVSLLCRLVADDDENVLGAVATAIAGVCEALLNEVGSALSDARTRPFLAGDAVVGIALTLIGLGGEHTSRGTALFER